MSVDEQVAETKLEHLITYIKELGSVAVAYSSGVDSTFLLRVAHDVLGNKAVAVTAESYMYPKRESNEARDYCKEEGIRQIRFLAEELKIDGFSHNPANRCYLCKRDLFQQIQKIAEENGIAYVVEGSNMDDMGDYRPGLQAIAELGIKSPLRECGLTKSEIRMLSKKLGLATWDKPSFACLASRFVYGETITEEKLKMVEQAEQLLMNIGFHQFRVRIHGMIARIEILPEEFDILMKTENREQIVTKFKEYGFTYVTMDLTGYRTGSMNEIL